MSLYIVGTPIGNLKDITFRAVEILKSVDIVLAEDTRRTGTLLKEYGIKGKKQISYNDYNKERKTNPIIQMLEDGKEIALVSDSGMPGISDPGFYLVRECVKQNINVVPVPGASSILSALVCSGLATDKFCFLGFFPKKEKKKNEFIEGFKKTEGTIIFFESPHRIKKTLSLMNELIPNYNIVIARELTKKFEEFIRGTVTKVNKLIENKVIKGEMVVLLNK
ncbi:MAG: 16S rRNA (cytidine(1402)-2'-O)-methyltransferase [Candidatus Woesearchaeota archaeon]|jgi:16S rRNA (cytidine1402-2'-O)-methyltransferase|nr:16S rRNA (cytidine(1402)-2'-O)-methyltransferase [Candidatus Woesearchaeota archaeon]